MSDLCICLSTNNLSEHIVEHTDMPSHLVKTVSGQEVFEQTQPRVRFFLSFSLSLFLSL